MRPNQPSLDQARGDTASLCASLFAACSFFFFARGQLFRFLRESGRNKFPAGAFEEETQFSFFQVGVLRPEEKTLFCLPLMYDKPVTNCFFLVPHEVQETLYAAFFLFGAFLLDFLW